MTIEELGDSEFAEIDWYVRFLGRLECDLEAIAVSIRLFIVFLLGCLCTSVTAEISLPPHLDSHMVVQHGAPIVITGTADPGAEVVVNFVEDVASAQANRAGRFRVELPAQEANATPRTLVIKSGRDRVELDDVLVGEVWFCSGQSNMVWRMRSSDRFEEFQADAHRPTIRTFNARNVAAEEPREELPGGWLVCTPETIGDFSGVAYHFGRHLSESLDVPIGLINSSWGGSRAEAWISEDSLRAIEPGSRAYERWDKLNAEMKADTGPRTRIDVDDSSWLQGEVPGKFDTFGLDDEVNGIFWQRIPVEIPDRWKGQDLVLSLGAIDDHDTTFFNGKEIGSTRGWKTPRNYTIPGDLVTPGKGVIAIRIVDGAGPGGLHGEPTEFFMHPEGNSTDRMAINGPARLVVAAEVAEVPHQHRPSQLYNGMLNPLRDVNFAGVIWYQGENNAIGEESVAEYEEVLSTMITDWRRAFKEPEMPFLIVQLPNFGREGGIFNYAAIRDIQRRMLELPGTGLAIVTDVGDEEDIHPRNKHDVGDRLARWALVDVYGKEGIVKSGPIVKGATQRGYTITIEFDTFGSSLATRDGKRGIGGFEAIGANGDMLESPARIASNNTVELLVPADWAGPTAIRYAWRESPSNATLVNEAGLPASPFEVAISQ